MSACSLHQNVCCDRKRQRESHGEPHGAGRGPDGAVRGAAFSSQPAGPFVARTLRLRILRPTLPPDARGHHREANPAIAGTLEALTRAAGIAPSRVQHSDPCRVCILAVTPTQRSRPCPRGLLSLCPPAGGTRGWPLETGPLGSGSGARLLCQGERRRGPAGRGASPQVPGTRSLTSRASGGRPAPATFQPLPRVGRSPRILPQQPHPAALAPVSTGQPRG